VTLGYVYYADSHQRQLVEISAELRQTAIATIQAVKTLLETGLMPKLFTANAVKDAVCTPNAAPSS